MRSPIQGLMALLATAAITGSVDAQVTCEDIEWDADVIANYEQVNDACLEVVERGGVLYARLHARVLRDGTKSIVIQYEHNDNSWGPPKEVTPPEGFRVMTDGGLIEVRDLERNQELNVYLREGRWELAMSDYAEPEIDPAMLVPVPHTEPLDPVEPIEAVPEPAVVPAEPVAPLQEDPPSSSRLWLWIVGLLALVALFVVARRRSA